MIIYIFRSFLVVVALVVSTCRFGYSTFEKQPSHGLRYLAEPQTIDEIAWVDSVMARLSERDRLAQLFMMPAYSNLDAKHENSIRKLVGEYKIGGLIFFQGTPEKQIALTNAYQALASVPLLIGMDAEWGAGMRLGKVPDFPRQMALGAIADNNLVYELGAAIARQCKLLGVHLNFAPVVDINNNPNNPVINFRSFGENSGNVAEKGVALMKGMQDNGVIACAKHFPGHGDTEADSHKSLPVMNHSRERLDSVELKPFVRLVEEGVAMTMIGHLYAPALEADGEAELPASISKNVITQLLRNEMMFQGLIISDALNMNGVKDHAAGKNVAVEALKAGHDILLMPFDVETNILEIEKAVESGKLKQADIDSKCRKVLTLKYRAGLTRFQPLKTAGIDHAFDTPEVKALIGKLTEKSVILASNSESMLPFRELEMHRFGYLAVGGFASGYEFAEGMERYISLTAKCEVASTPTAHEIQQAKSSLKDCDILIVGYHATSASPKVQYGASRAVFNLLTTLAQGKRVAFVCFGSPYFLSFIPDASLFSSIVVAHSNTGEAQDKTSQLLFGGIPFAGKMPVTASPVFPEGAGIDTHSAIRLKYIVPEEAGIDSRMLKTVDSIAEAGIRQRAFPGCQILAAHRGEVFYHKSFGRHSYSDMAATGKLSDVYDLASVTKVAATLPLIMRLSDEHSIALDSGIGKYIKLNARSDKGSLSIRDILLHRSGLPAWLPFYYKYMVTPDGKPAISTKKGGGSIKIPGTNRYLKSNYRLDPQYFAKTRTARFNHPVAEGLYGSDELRNEIYSAIDSCKLMPAVYRYSDLGFIYLQRIIEAVYHAPEDVLVQSLFYAPLGMNSTGYLPLTRISQKNIPPTEDDRMYRKQLLHGHVHDPLASLCGGVAGNAGVFGTANDLAKLCQMYLNKGMYGGTRYLTEETVALFTACAGCEQGSRRGLGFDKPEPDSHKKNPVCSEASLESYGHLGYTGTMIWIDPAHELVYIFLSNRVNPSAENNRLSTLGTRNEILAGLIRAVENISKQ
ncbi:MAG: serine hydrolase [Prevotellaceae bacterium]|jgi:beta-glucosidase-like glycosyl hydrolase/CubicO group peptidase (beta-lactamase class C family)|nr:serine hydrolase [Prevotellaceae bacterium]